jgi:hypothetical protein
MIFQTKFTVPEHLTSVSLTQAIVKSDMIGNLAQHLAENIELQHTAEMDRIVYFAELVYLKPTDYREIIRDLGWLYQNNYSHEHRDRLWSIREKIKGI